MKRTSVNPTEWGLAFSMNQGEIIEDASKILHFSGQVALEPDSNSDMGVSVVHAGDIRGQMQAALANIDAVLQEAGMERSDIVSLRFFTTDVDGFLANYDAYSEWIAPAKTRPPQSLLGVNRLVLPELLVEIEATAAS